MGRPPRILVIIVLTGLAVIGALHALRIVDAGAGGVAAIVVVTAVLPVGYALLLRPPRGQSIASLREHGAERCAACDYPMLDRHGRCSECGWSVEVEILRRTERARRLEQLDRTAVALLVIAVVCVLAIVAVVLSPPAPR